jgi:hypothetical protein
MQPRWRSRFGLVPLGSADPPKNERAPSARLMPRAAAYLH